MPQNDKSHATVGRSEFEGKELVPANQEELNEAIRLAFDYRGDITLKFKDGSSQDGFVYNFDHKAGIIYLFVAEGKESTPQTTEYSKVGSVFFSGADKAFGTSWDDWQAKSAKQRAEEAKRHEEKIQQMGII